MLVSALDSAGQLRRQQRSTTGAALRIACRAKERSYPELLPSERCRFVTRGIELGGQWRSKAAQFVRMLARSRARQAPPVLRSGATSASPAGLPCSGLRQPALWQPACCPSSWAMLPTWTGSTRSQRCPRRDLAPAGFAVSSGFFPTVDCSCLGPSHRAGRLGARFPVMPRIGTANWPEKAQKKKCWELSWPRSFKRAGGCTWLMYEELSGAFILMLGNLG